MALIYFISRFCGDLSTVGKNLENIISSLPKKVSYTFRARKADESKRGFHITFTGVYNIYLFIYLIYKC